MTKAADSIAATTPSVADLIPAMLEGVAVIGEDWQYRYVSPTAARQAGMSPDLLIGSSVLERVPGAESADILARWADCMEHGRPQRFEASFTRPGGEQARCEFHVRRVAEGILVLSRDVTDGHGGTSGQGARDEAEQALRDSERRLAVAAQSSGDGLWDWDLRTGNVWFSDRFAEMLGRDRAEMTPTLDAWAGLLHPDDRERARAAVDALVHGSPERVDFEARIRRADGAYIWVHNRGQIVERDEDGQPRRVAGTHTDTTARREAEEALRQSNRRIRSLMDAMHDGVLRFEAGGRITEMNPAAGRVLGVDPAEVVGLEPSAWPWTVLDEHGDVLPLSSHPAVVVPETRRPITDLLLGLRRADGHTTWVTENAVPGAVDADGNVLEVVVSFADVTRLRAALEAASASETRLRQVLDTALDAMWVTDRGVIDWANPAMERLFGRPLADIVGRRIETLFEPDDRGDVADRIARLERGEPQASLRRIVRPDGEARWLEIRAHSLGAGRAEAVARDVTDRRSLEEERERLIQAVDRSFDAIEVAGPDSRIVYANEAFATLVGRPRQEVIGLDDHFYAAPEAVAHLGPEVLAALEGSGAWSGDVDVARPDGSRVVASFRIARVDGPHGPIGYIATARDVTQERELDAKLAEAERLEAVGRLAGGVAHDFNNILTAILGHAELASSEIPAASPALEDLRQIATAANRAQALTRQLLVFGRRSILQPRQALLAEVAADLAPMLRRLIGEDIELALEASPEGGPVLVDRSLLEHAITNLVVNARDAMPRGGTIRLLTGPAQPARDGWSMVRVVDEGDGIAPDVEARMFEPFFTTKEVGRGTGLGLAMVQGFVAQSGGSIEVDTQTGVGSSLTILLPTTAAAAPLPEREASPDPVGARGTVLIAEDDRMVRDLARRLLVQAGYDVLAVASAADAIDVLTSDQSVDLLFTDVVMAGMSGLELAGVAQGMRPGLRVLAASGYTDDEMDRRGISLGGMPFLAKPYGRRELVAAVAAALAP